MDELPQGTLVWLIVLAALATLFVLVLRRMSALVGRTRSLERYQRIVTLLDARLAATADPFVAQLDEIRRRSGDPRALAQALPGVQDALRAIAAEGRAQKVPPGLTGQAAALQEELERAVRATELVEHGVDALLADRGGRDLEAQTALKRGTLNMRHAREAVGRLAAEIGAVRPADLSGRTGGSRHTGTSSSGPTYLVDADLDPGER